VCAAGTGGSVHVSAGLHQAHHQPTAAADLSMSASMLPPSSSQRVGAAGGTRRLVHAADVAQAFEEALGEGPYSNSLSTSTALAPSYTDIGGVVELTRRAPHELLGCEVANPGLSHSARRPVGTQHSMPLTAVGHCVCATGGYALPRAWGVVTRDID